MLDKLLYILLLFLSITGANIGFGGIALRDILTIILFGAMITKIGLLGDNCFKAYFIFILCFSMGCIVAEKWDFLILSILRYYMVSFLGWNLTLFFIKKDPSFKQTLLYTLLIIGLFDAFVTFSQFTMNTTWYSPIESFFKFQVYEGYSAYENQFSGNEVYARYLPGIFGSAAVNGYYLAICSVLSMFPLLTTKKIYSYFLPFIFLLATFACQERSALGISLIILIYITKRYLSQLNGIQQFFIIPILIAGMYLIGLSLFNISTTFNLRYSSLGADDTGRFEIYRNTLTYILDYPFFPCVKELIDLYGWPPHNIFLNAYVYGGPISFCAIMFILFLQSKKALLIIKKDFNSPEQIAVFLFTCGWVVFTLNSLVHNRSVVTGELLCWVIWGIMDQPHEEEEPFILNG